MEQITYWNSVSKTKEFTTPFQFDEFSRILSADAAILDVGCGYGRTLQELYTHGYRNLTGIDFSQGMIERGHSLYPHLNLQVKTNSEIHFPDNSFDAVILFAVLTCIADNKKQAALISEIRRVLKTGGILYVNDFLLNTDERNIARYQKYEPEYGTYGIFELPEGVLLRHHSEDYIRQLLKEFDLITFKHLTFTTMNGHTSNGFYCFGR